MTLRTDKTMEQIADRAIRREILAAAHGPDPEAARAALDSLWHLYRLRLPLVEARLDGISPSPSPSRTQGVPGGEGTDIRRTA